MGEVPRRGGEGKRQLSHAAEHENNTKTERDTGNPKNDQIYIKINIDKDGFGDIIQLDVHQIEL